MRAHRDPQTYAIIGAGMAVHRALGCGFLEAVYGAALSIEFERRCIPFLREAGLRVSYEGKQLPVGYRVDFICYESVLVEVKALDRLGHVEQGQMINYLKASGFRRGLLLNFGTVLLQYRRIVLGWVP